MTNRARAILLGIGLIAGWSASTIFGGWAGAPVAAQPAQKPADPGRYQISAFGYGGGGVGTTRESGAYIIDTATGEVFVIVGNDGPPTPVGSVRKDKK
jgi:hypothetical protein